MRAPRALGKALVSSTHLSLCCSSAKSLLIPKERKSCRTESLSTSQQGVVLYVCLLGSNRICSGMNYSEGPSLSVIRGHKVENVTTAIVICNLHWKIIQCTVTVFTRRFLGANHFRIEGNKSGRLEKKHDIFSRLGNPSLGLKVLCITLPRLGQPYDTDCLWR